MIAIIKVKCKCGNWVRFRITANGTYIKRCWGSRDSACSRDVKLHYAGKARGWYIENGKEYETRTNTDLEEYP